jgi:uncharacterized protein YbjQ (UPF0145 family)
MRISETDAVDGSRVLYPIGKIAAATGWHAKGEHPHSGNWRERVLADLVRRAEDIDADAIIALDYTVDPDATRDEAGVTLQRVVATGIAVKLSVAA